MSVGRTLIYHFLRRTANTLVVKAPPHHGGAVRLAVSNAWGTTIRTVRYIGAPHLGTLSPYRGPRTGGTAVTITGRNLAQVRTVEVGGASVPFTAHGDHALTLRMPAHAAGPVVVTARLAVRHLEPEAVLVPRADTDTDSVGRHLEADDQGHAHAGPTVERHVDCGADR